MIPIAIRRAEPADVEAMVRMHIQAWRESYSALLSAQFFARQEELFAGRVRRHQEAIAAGEMQTWLAMDDGGIAGFAVAGPARDQDLAARLPLELYSIYCLQRVHGLGVGRALLDCAIGAAPAYLWVLEENPRAQRFYRKNGFEADGARQLLSGLWENLAEVRMVRQAGQPG